MAKFFTTAGPLNATAHYCLPPIERIKLAEVEGLIERRETHLGQLADKLRESDLNAPGVPG